MGMQLYFYSFPSHTTWFGVKLETVRLDLVNSTVGRFETI